MGIKVVDTTLRDGEQTAGISLRLEDKIRIAGILNDLGIYQIEAGIPAMGGSEKKSVAKIAELGLKSVVSSWNRMNLEDIRHSLDCNTEIIHISVPSSDIQIKSKLNKDRVWVVEQLKRCLSFAAEKKVNVTVGLEDASRADFKFLLKLIAVAYLEGVKRIRYADTVGILYRQRIYEEIRKIKEELSIDIEIHAHNDLGMAVSNSVAAVKSGADFVDCTIGGIGERAGNCDYLKFIDAAGMCLGASHEYDLKIVKEAQQDILKMIKGKFYSSYS